MPQDDATQRDARPDQGRRDAGPFPPPPPADAAVETVRSDGDPRLLLLCDHASNAVPSELGDLGLSEADRSRHIAYDVGARGVVLALSEILHAPAVLSTFSRLVIDPNRGVDDPTLVMRLYDRSIIPGNARVDDAEIARRTARYHAPYHRAIGAAIDAAAARLGPPPAAGPFLLSIHSFTPQLRGRPPRPWHVGVLWEKDVETATRLLAALRAEPDLCVGDNAPYSGALEGDVMWTHGVGRGLRHVLIEIRNDLIATPGGQRAWAARLAPILRAIVLEPSHS